MTFKEVLAQVIDWLQQDKRLSYRALKRQFTLDDDYLDDLKAELIEARASRRMRKARSSSGREHPPPRRPPPTSRRRPSASSIPYSWR